MRRFARLILFLVAIGSLVLAFGFTRSQAQEPPPPAQLAQGAKPLSQIPVVSMPGVDVAALLAEDVQRESQGLPLRFAQPIPVQISPANSGLWETLTSGEQVWRLRIHSDQAISLNLGFTRFWMPAGGRLFIYSPDYTRIVGPFTARDNALHGQLWTPLVRGENIVIEVILPAGAASQLQLALTSVNHGYAEMNKPRTPTSGACNVDVVCGAANGYPQVDAWREEIRSAGVYTVNGSWTCSGALVNNTAQDLKPYFLTANHCGVNSGNAASVVAYWNFENSTCRIPGSPASGGPGDGQLNQFNTGAFWRASYAASDFTLIEFDSPINPAFNPHFSGWSRSSGEATSTVVIHHPNTDEKRISFSNRPTTTTSYLSPVVPGDGTHVRVVFYDLGTTEPGSSGSPLYDQDHHIIGQLHGGYASCTSITDDWYGRVSVSWNGGGASSNRLRDWLDPLNTGVVTLDGRDIIESPFLLAVTPASAEVCAPLDATYSISVTAATIGYNQPVTLTVAGVPAGAEANFSENPVIPEGTSVLTISQTDAAAAGSYDLDIIGHSTTSTLTATVGLNLYNGIPGLPGLLLPANSAINQSFTPTFWWNAGTQSRRFAFELDLSPLFKAPISTATDLLTTTFGITSPLTGGACYWWRVSGDNACGPGSWSAPFHFSTVSLATSLFDNIENGAGNWTHQAATGADNWAISTVQSHSPTHAWFVPDDNVVTDSHLRTTNSLLVGSGSTLTFWHRFEFESGYDGAVLEISANGIDWFDLGTHITANGYNDTLSTSYLNPLGGRQAWSGDLTTWTQVTVDLSAYAGQNVRIRWRIGCDSSVSAPGWYIDDVTITAPLPPNPAPTLSSITPASGQTTEPTPVTIYGTGFITNPVMKLGETWLLDVTRISSATLEATVPQGMTSGVYTLTLYNGDCQEAVLPEAFTITSNAPIANNDYYTLTEDSPVTPLDVSANDVNAPGITGTLTLLEVGAPNHGGAVEISGTVVLYQPAHDFNGTESFTYTIRDILLQTDTAWVTVKVAPVNDPPTVSAVPDLTITVGASLEPITFTIGDIDTPLISLTVSTTTTNLLLLPEGSLVITGTGFTRTLLITPAAGVTGSATITLVVSDGIATTNRSFTLTVLPRRIYLPVVNKNLSK